MPKKKRTTKRKKTDPVKLYYMPVDPYEEMLFWSWAPTRDLFLAEVERSLPEVGNIKVPEFCDAYCNVVIKGDRIYPIIWVSDPDQPWLLAHELEHFVHWLLDYKGMTCTSNSDEAYAYLLGYLMKTMIESKRDGRY